MLARALPFKIIRKHSDNRFQIEALLFGTAGMLEEGLFKEAICDKYYQDLFLIRNVKDNWIKLENQASVKKKFKTGSVSTKSVLDDEIWDDNPTRFIKNV